MRSLVRPVSHWLVFAAAIVLGIVIGIGTLRSMVWAVAFAAIGAAVAAILLDTRPVRNTAITLVTVFVCLLVGEGIIDFAPRGGSRGGPPVATTVPRFEPQPLFIADPGLGWTLRPSSVIRAVRSRGEHIIYDTTYTIDARGQRVTPDSNPDGDVVLFLGDSFMFGDGLPDSETLPQRFAIQTERRFRVINFGVSAYGPHQALRQIEEGVIERAVGGRKARAAYLYFNDDQLPRAAGHKDMAWWWKASPQYALTGDSLRLVGTAGERWARRGPVEVAVSEAVQASTIATTARRFLRVYPQLELSEAIVRRIRVSLRERYGVDLVAIYWSMDQSRFFPTNISWMLERAGVRTMFIPDLMAPAGLTVSNGLIAEDGHPNVRLNDAIAAALATRYAP